MGYLVTSFLMALLGGIYIGYIVGHDRGATQAENALSGLFKELIEEREGE